MEPVTHLLTGTCLGRSGFNQKTAYATLAMTLAAEAPDLDMLWKLRGPVAELQYHRGIFHSFIAAPFIALFIVAVIWLLHRFRQSLRGYHFHREGRPPIRWGLLWFFAMLADLSHLFLDWTTSYGVRLFLPWNPHWYAGSFVFVVEPILLALLLLALIAPAIFGLADSEIGARQPRFRGQGWAIFALSAMIVFWSWRYAEHTVALRLLEAQPITQDAALRISVNPYPINPYRWYAIVETKDYYRTAILNLRADEAISPDSEHTYYKQPLTPAIRAAEGSWLGRIYMDWSQFPLVEEAGAEENRTFENSTVAPPSSDTRVTFRDLRFTYDVFALYNRKNPPLSGSVTVAPNGQIDQMELHGHVQH